MFTLPLKLSGVNLEAYVSMLSKFYRDSDYIIKRDSMLLNKKLSYMEELVAILDRDVQRLRFKGIRS